MRSSNAPDELDEAGAALLNKEDNGWFGLNWVNKLKLGLFCPAYGYDGLAKPGPNSTLLGPLLSMVPTRLEVKKPKLRP